MAEKIVSAFITNYLPNLKESNSITKELIHYLVQRVKDCKKINTVQGRKELKNRLETEINFLKLNNTESCNILARVFRERFDLKNESDEDLALLLRLEDPILGFDFFERPPVQQKKLFQF